MQNKYNFTISFPTSPFRQIKSPGEYKTGFKPTWLSQLSEKQSTLNDYHYQTAVKGQTKLFVKNYD